MAISNNPTLRMKYLAKHFTFLVTQTKEMRQRKNSISQKLFAFCLVLFYNTDGRKFLENFLWFIGGADKNIPKTAVKRQKRNQSNHEQN